MPVPALLASVINSIVGEAVNTALENTFFAPPTAPDLGAPSARVFPDGSRKGYLSPPGSMTEVEIDGTTLQRAPGMTIRNHQNMIVMQSTIQSKTPVRYQLDASGAVFRVWLLNQAEIATK